MKRGEIWVGNLNPSRGREIGKIRPVLIIQSDELGEDITPMAVILPLSTQIYPAFKHWRVTIHARGRLLKPCQVVTDQPRAPWTAPASAKARWQPLAPRKWRWWRRVCWGLWGCCDVYSKVIV